MIKNLLQNLSLSQFRKNEKGNIFISTALLAPLLVLAIGVAVDTAEIYRARVNFQNALDAGALMAAKVIAAQNDKAKAQTAGENVFKANIRNLDPNKASINFIIADNGCGAGSITAVATLDHKVFFNAFHKVADSSDKPNHVRLNGETEVTCGNTTLEIALVLDNSGSMGDRSGGKVKLDTLKEAALDLVHTLHNSFGSLQGVSEPLKFSVVPFSSMVNIGNQNENQSWMDTQGLSSIHHEHLNWEEDPDAIDLGGGNGFRDKDGVPLTRFTVFDSLRTQWKGCVETRPYPYLTNDSAPSSNNPDTLIVPSFAPDTPDNWSGRKNKTKQSGNQIKAICTQFQRSRGGRRPPNGASMCETWSDGYTGRVHPQNPQYLPKYNDRVEYQRGQYIGPSRTTSAGGWVDYQTIYEKGYWNSYLKDDHNFPDSLNFHPMAESNTGVNNQYKRQKWTWKYFKNNSGVAPQYYDTDYNRAGLPTVVGLDGGPNHFCLSVPLSPLSTDEDVTNAAIQSMTAVGSTHIQQGTVWGWRTLSQNQPFTQGRDTNASQNRKIMIIMTDGENTYYPVNQWGHGKSEDNKSLYGAHGMAVNERIYDGNYGATSGSHSFSDYAKGLDNHLAQTCQNAKADHIEIHTIAFNVAAASPVRALLQTCASRDPTGKPLYYPAEDSAELTATFQEIAEKLSDLRISK